MTTRFRLFRTAPLALVLASVLAAGCDSAADRDEEARQTTKDGPASPGAAPESAAVAANLASTPLAAPQIAAVVVAANQAEIASGQMAQQKATDPRVKEFAGRLVAEHTAARDAAMAAFGQGGITPEENPVSQQLRTNAQSTMASLQSMSGAEFDRAFVDAQIQAHQSSLDASDRVLAPNADDAALQKVVADNRAAVAAHLEHLRQLQSSLVSGTGGSGTPAASGDTAKKM